MALTRTRERLAAGLPWPADQVLELYDEVVHALRLRGIEEPDDVAYSGVMAAGAVFSADRQPCPTAQMVLYLVEPGDALVAGGHER